MIDQNTDFFKITNNFAKTAHVPSIPIIESKLDFIPKITIAIPTYKRPEFLKEALDSAINQTGYTEYEIIVVDNNPERDCETEKLLKTYSDIRLSYYKNTENIGMFGNWNRCIELSRGEYMTILNDDDYLFLDYLETCSKQLCVKDTIDMLYVGFGVLKNGELSSKKLKISSYRIGISNFILGPRSIGSLGVLLKKNKIYNLGGFNSELYPTADYVFWTLCSKNLKYIYCINNVLSVYRWAENESFKLEVQEKNIIYDGYLRFQISNHSQLKYFIKPALAVFDYKQFLNICKFSVEFKNKYYCKEYDLYKKNVKLYNLCSYYILISILKVLKVLNK